MPIIEGFPCMLANPFGPKKVKGWPVGVEIKLDGMRALVTVKHVSTKDEKTGEELDEYEVATQSREGNVFTSVRKVEDAILDTFAESGLTEDYVFDGELHCGTFKKTASQIKKKNIESPDAVFIIFDMIPLREFNEQGTAELYPVRRQKLKEFFAAAGMEQQQKLRLSKAVLAENVDQVMAFYREAREMGHEGVVVKQLEGDLARWQGRRTNGWLKIKAKETIDLKIVGAALGKPEGKYAATLGNLICELPRDEKFPDRPATVDVGTGITDEDRHELWAEFQAGTLVGKIAELSFHELTPDGSLRHPVFHTVRIDKTKADQ